ncbi:MAG: response regulator transcription factor [Patescibacteria group bacterium]|nr:response regulator transcription factor [Patescibacteria group bacterium]MDE2590441.1 response regulator transcription factor [Patescibacteria group bacterium]
MKILLVEDEHKIANSIKQGLEQEHYVVDTVYDGTQGYDLASTEEYDLLILDRLLPGIDGMEICRKIREAGKHTPILMLTAKVQIQDKVEGLTLGADDYMTKPFAFEELLARIKALARRPRTVRENTLAVADLTLDTDSFEVRRSGKNISLSAKEFALLTYLMHHANKTLTKEQIINHVWNYDASILPNTVEVFIGYLRSKIDKPFPKKSKLIHTIRGFGYKIGEEGR